MDILKCPKSKIRSIFFSKKNDFFTLNHNAVNTKKIRYFVLRYFFLNIFYKKNCVKSVADVADLLPI